MEKSEALEVLRIAMPDLTEKQLRALLDFQEVNG